MKRFLALFVAVTLMVLCAAPVLAAGLSISPPSVEFDVPAEGSAEVEFLVYDFTGDLQISLEDIPLRVEPTTVPVTAEEGGTRVVLTFYGDESLGSKIYEGKIRFLAMTGGTVAMGIKVRATVTNLVEGETPVLATPEESPPPEEALVPSEESPAGESPPQQSAQALAESPPAPSPPQQSAQAPAKSPPAPPATSETTEWPILPVAGIAAGAAITITLIIVVARRRSY